MNAIELFGLRFDAVHAGFEADVLDRLGEAGARARPHSLNSAAWLVWHVARVEDVAVNRLVADRPQVLREGAWDRWLGVANGDIGTGMEPHEADDLGCRIDLGALRGYLRAVADRTRTLAADMGEADLDLAVEPSHVHRVVAEEEVLLPAAAWVGEVWSQGRRRGWFLLQTALLHPYGHLHDCLTVRGLLLEG